MQPGMPLEKRRTLPAEVPDAQRPLTAVIRALLASSLTGLTVLETR
jgi:hypothetical protein